MSLDASPVSVALQNRTDLDIYGRDKRGPPRDLPSVREIRPMTPIEAMLLDLIRIAESPLYSAYRWLGREIGRDMRLDRFLALIDHLLEADTLRLWLVDPATQERTRLPRVPAQLDARYSAESTLDPAFDPFGLSLTLGPSARRDEDPEWEVDFDFAQGRFHLTAVVGREAKALGQLERLFPDLELHQRERTQDGDRAQIFGVVNEASRGS